GYLPAEKSARINKIQEIEQQSLRLNQTQIFIETPYRNQQLLLDLVTSCAGETELCIATDLTLASERINTKSIAEWKRKLPDCDKRPTVFVLYRRPADRIARKPAARQKK
ncbi:MAG: hypothetical protein Q8K43_05330, partial [Sulfurimicrobium sp.]|nr:hypothetical protein [Sulfurimicrobium sp.]